MNVEGKSPASRKIWTYNLKIFRYFLYYCANNTIITTTMATATYKTQCTMRRRITSCYWSRFRVSNILPTSFSAKIFIATFHYEAMFTFEMKVTWSCRQRQLWKKRTKLVSFWWAAFQCKLQLCIISPPVKFCWQKRFIYCRLARPLNQRETLMPQSQSNMLTTNGASQ